jgi:hypothetical protein
MIDGIRQPAREEGNGHVGHRVDGSDNPRVPLAVAFGYALGTSVGNSKHRWERKIGTVAASLIPTAYQHHSAS